MNKFYSVLGILFAWSIIFILYMNMKTYNSNYTENHKINLEPDLKKIYTVKQENKKLHILADVLENLEEDINDNCKSEIGNILTKRLTKAKKIVKQLISGTCLKCDANVRQPNSEQEYLRNKIKNSLKEMWNFIKSEMDKIKNMMATPKITQKIGEVLEDLGEWHRSLLTDIYYLRQTNGAATWRQQESEQLGDLIQKRLYHLQNPKDCSKAKKLLCRVNHGCGIGCELHHLVYCFILAYGTKRTMIFEYKGMKYKRWNKLFKPVSETCVSSDSKSTKIWSSPEGIKDVQVVYLPNMVGGPNLKLDFIPPAIPEDIADQLKLLYDQPDAWWIGQFLKYILRPQPEFEKDLKNTEKRLGFKHPVVGVQVRRTDKIKWEASLHTIDEYMEHVEEYYKLLKRRQNVDVMRVYLASDDPKVLKEAKRKYPEYKFISDTKISKTADLKTRFTHEALKGAMKDIYFLSNSDYLVFTLSSNFNRLAYEIMQTIQPDATNSVRSLDHRYYLTGQNPHIQTAIYDHKPRSKEEIHLRTGDLIQPKHDYSGHYGYINGTNKRTGKKGLYPSYKVVDKVQVVKFPKYPEGVTEDAE